MFVFKNTEGGYHGNVSETLSCMLYAHKYKIYYIYNKLPLLTNPFNANKGR